MKSKGIKIAIFGIVGIAALSAVTMLLWNFLIPDIFGLATISFWQALGLFVLSRILFGRFGGGRMMCGRRFEKMRGGFMAEKWASMTAEQRKEFICKRRKFGFGYPFGIEHFDRGQHEEPTKED